MFDTYLVPPGTTAREKGSGEAVALADAQYRTFLAVVEVTDHVEQEALEVSVYGSADGTTWSPKPLVRFPQIFYRSSTPRLIDLTGTPDIRFLRAQWDATRWGRGPEAPLFEFSVKLTEVEPALLREAMS